MRAMGILMDDNTPYQQFRNAGYFETKVTIKNGFEVISTQVTGKGLRLAIMALRFLRHISETISF